MSEIQTASVRKACKEKLRPTPTRERNLELSFWRCRVLVSRYAQEAELKSVRAAFIECAAIHSHMLQDVLSRLDKTYQAFFRRLERVEGGQEAGLRRFAVRERFPVFTFNEFGDGPSAHHRRPVGGLRVVCSSGKGLPFIRRHNCLAGRAASKATAQLYGMIVFRR